MFPAPKQVDFSADEMDYLQVYVKNKLEHIRAKNRSLREDDLPRMVRTYKGIPAEEEKTFPWPGASNLVVQLAGEYSDELLSRIMAIYMTDPLFVAKLLGDILNDMGDAGEGELQREEIENLLCDLAVEPTELDLYRVEELWWSSAIKYGTGIVKSPWEYIVEKEYIYLSGGTPAQGKVNYTFKDCVKRDGPKPENVSLNRFGVDPKYSNMEDADFLFHIIAKDKYKLEEMKEHPELFHPDRIDKIKNQPDRSSPDLFTMELQGTGRNNFTFMNECSYEWDIYECWFQYNKDGDKYSLIAYYHLLTDVLLGCIYNPYPQNIRAFEDARLSYDEETFWGYGFCEMLECYQRELSDTRNWKIDNKRFSTTGVGRINKNSKLSTVIQMFPGLFIPADKDEVESLRFGENALALNTEDEQFILNLATRRAGVDPATGGSGGGIVNQKRGIYSSQGTAMVLQQANNRNNLRMSDMRSAHVKLARKILLMYSYFGMGNKLKKYGERADRIAQALNNYKIGKLGLVIKPATGSLNKELEKQNDILLSATLERLYAGDAQILQLLSSGQLPPEMAEYYVDMIKAKNFLMKHILRNFGHDDTSRLIPVPPFLKERRNAGYNAANQNRQSGGGVNQGQGSIGAAIPTTPNFSLGPGIPTGTARNNSGGITIQ